MFVTNDVSLIIFVPLTIFLFKAGGKELGTISPAANSGLQNNPPYSLTVSEGDYYEIELDGATTVTVETSGTNPRAVLFGIQAR